MKKVLGLLAMLASLAAAAPAGAQVSPNNVITYPSGTPKAWILVIHGGAWQGGANWVQSELGVASWFVEQGYGTYTVDYRSAPLITNTFADVVSAYDYLRARVGSAPICAWGESAGGNLALMLASVRPLNCVISQAGPTDLWRLPYETADGVSAYNAWVNLVLPPFSSSWATMGQYSPDQHCPMTAKVLLGASSADRLVPQQQMSDEAGACPNVATYLLDGNPAHGPLAPWTHADVTQAALGFWSSLRVSFLPH